MLASLPRMHPSLHPRTQTLTCRLLSVKLAPHSPQRKRFNLRMKSFSLDSPESPSVVGAVGPSSASHSNSGGSLTESQHMYQQHPLTYQTGSLYVSSVAYQQYAQQQHQQANLYQADQQQQQPQHPKQPQQLDQLDQQHQQPFADSHGYMTSNSMRSSRHQFQPTSYQHRHSYHNPFYYQHEQQPNSTQVCQIKNAQAGHLLAGEGAKRGSKDSAIACVHNDCKCAGSRSSSWLDSASLLTPRSFRFSSSSPPPLCRNGDKISQKLMHELARHF